MRWVLLLLMLLLLLLGELLLEQAANERMLHCSDRQLLRQPGVLRTETTCVSVSEGSAAERPQQSAQAVPTRNRIMPAGNDACTVRHPHASRRTSALEPRSSADAGCAQSPPVHGCAQLPDDGCSTGSSCGLRDGCGAICAPSCGGDGGIAGGMPRLSDAVTACVCSNCESVEMRNGSHSDQHRYCGDLDGALIQCQHIGYVRMFVEEWPLGQGGLPATPLAYAAVRYGSHAASATASFRGLGVRRCGIGLQEARTSAVRACGPRATDATGTPPPPPTPGTSSGVARVETRASSTKASHAASVPARA